MPTRFKLLSLLTLTAVALAPGLQAQEITSPYRHIETSHSIGLFAGYLWTDRGAEGREIGLESAPLMGLRYSLRLGGPATGEASASFAPSRREIYQRAPGATEGELVSTGHTIPTTLMFLEAGVRFQLTGPRTWNGLAPYLGASGGLVTDLGRGAATEEEIELPADQRFRLGPGLAVGVTAGTEWFLTERVSLRFEARNLIWRLTSPAGFNPATGVETRWTNNPVLSVGGALHF
jgi:hypothetical protein